MLSVSSACEHYTTPSLVGRLSFCYWFSLISREGHREQAAAEDSFHLPDLGLTPMQSEADLSHLNQEAEPQVINSHPLQG